MESKGGKKKSSSSRSLFYEAPLGYSIEDIRPAGGIKKFRSAAYSNCALIFVLAVAASNTMAGLVTGPDTRKELHSSHGTSDHENRPPTSQSVSKICRVCGDEIGYKEDGSLFVACHECGFPVCRPCYDYERSEGHQSCPQCNARYKRQKGCPRVAGDEDNFDADDFDDEFPIKSGLGDSDRQHAVINHSENGDYNHPQWHPTGSFAGSVAGKDFEGEREAYSNAEWKERVEKWKVRQEKRGLVSKDDGNNDQGDDDDFLLAEARQPMWRKIPIPSSKISPYRIVIVLRLFILAFFLRFRILTPANDAYPLWLISVICETWFAFSWILDQFPKWCPTTRETYLDRLSMRFEREGEPNRLAPVDVYVSTVDPLKEPPIITANTVLSILDENPMIFLNSLTYKYIENHYCAVETAKQSRAMDADTPLLTNNHSSQDEEQKLSTVKRFGNESKRLWKLAGPAIFTAICQYSLGALTQTFAGLVGELDLAAVAVENSVIAGLAFGVMLGMGSALETLCGQAYGAGQIRMLGIYMQRSWVILLTTACILVPIYVWSPPILELIGETTEISEAAGKFALWMIPQLFAYAMNFPIQKFLQAQRKVFVMAWISVVVLVLHIFFSWLLIFKLGWGLTGAAVTLNTSWWLIVIAQLLYIFITKSDGAWDGFSWLAFADLWGFVKLSLASAVMLCLEFWYLMVLVVITGRLPNPLVPVDAISICMNINGWDAMIALGFNAAISVRVSNELGAGNARAAKFSVLVVSITSVSIGVVCMVLVLATRDYFPYLFTTSEAVGKETTKLALLLGVTVLLNSLQPVLSGVAVGAGWQAIVAYINIGCYYIVGLPAGIILGFTFGFGAEGIWSGMIGGICLQTIILIVVTSRTNWTKEAEQAESRVKRWGGSTGDH